MQFVEARCTSAIDVCTAASRKYNTEETAEDAMAPQLNEKRNGSLGRKLILPLPETGKLVVLLYGAYKPLVVNQ